MDHAREQNLAPDPFLAGIQLFNAGEYWHAHEQWEICWREAQGIEAEFYKALIQIAAALVKWRQGNRRGLQLNWAKAQRRLAQLPAVYRGVDLAALGRAMADIVADPERGERPRVGT
ncbi:hypothetical protein A6A03_09900 [Chloroflexus islandicus]|uniref:DUF309 domain-containing protein n=1 Tax=Chloroflexus islandicus TaxID=1707952 RepID=A0A178MG45_9CHLR|nr:DUF309 domain-containing protein [Chloroflexus islandicus]OAN47556.1 hypothetical protein A6A03_09900 [Chloroflexus islandicus]